MGLIYNNKIVFIYYLPESVHEGGTARNKAFYEKFKELGAKMTNIYTKSNIVRLGISLKTLTFLFFIKRKTIFINQGALLFIFSMILLRISFLRKIIFSLLNKVSRNNKFIIEINDLIYEQSIDLELNVDEIFRILQEDFFSIKDCNYIFASNEMELYVQSKYAVPHENCSVIINGAPKVTDYSHVIKNQKWIDSNKNKFVYAGSLNKGRQIEDLINVFFYQDHSLLIILGNEGDWLNEIKLPDNIIYLGNFEENIAHYIVSICDMGIIPYSADRLYYNLCYPTKASFYITAGLPILSTPLNELQNVFKNSDVVIFSPFDNWSNIVNGMNKSMISIMKEKVAFIKEEYYWESLLSKIKI